MKPFLILIAAMLATSGLALLGQPQPPKNVVEKNKQLEFLNGEWNIYITAITKEGKEIKLDTGCMTSATEIKGLLIHREGFRKKTELGFRSWLFYNHRKNIFYEVGYDLAGNFEIRTGDFDQNGDLDMTMIDAYIAQDNVPRIWRKKYTQIKPESFLVLTYYTEDEGKVWIESFREKFVKAK
jgi:hypothetical protein